MGERLQDQLRAQRLAHLGGALKLLTWLEIIAIASLMFQRYGMGYEVSLFIRVAMCGTVALTTLGYYWTRRGELRRAVTLTLGMLTTFATLFVFSEDGYVVGAFLSCLLALIAVGAALLEPDRRAFAWGVGASTLGCACMGARLWQDPLWLGRELGPSIQYIVSMWVMLLFLVMMARVLTRTFQRVLSSNEIAMQELAATNTALDEARLQALAASRAKSAFLANMSHELRTPLNAIIGYCELIGEEADELGAGALRPDLVRVEQASHHLLGLIHDILDLSKIEAGKMELTLEAVDLAPLLHQLEGTVAPLAARQRNTLTITHDEAALRIVSDRTKLRQILLNLISNACKFTEAGEVGVSVGASDDAHIVLRVRDTGVGIAPEQLGRLFGAFEQLDDTSTRKHGGTGLGLAITRRFCELLGGTITVESVLGEGTTFTVRLPVGGPALA